MTARTSRRISPTRINNELLARGLLAAQENRELSDNERQAIKRELNAAFDEYREGVELEV